MFLPRGRRHMFGAAAWSSLITSPGALVSTACTDWVATVLPLAARSAATPAATLTVRSPSKLAVGVTNIGKASCRERVNAPVVPPTTKKKTAVKNGTAPPQQEGVRADQ